MRHLLPRLHAVRGADRACAVRPSDGHLQDVRPRQRPGPVCPRRGRRRSRAARRDHRQVDGQAPGGPLRICRRDDGGVGAGTPGARDRRADDRLSAAGNRPVPGGYRRAHGAARADRGDVEPTAAGPSQPRPCPSQPRPCPSRPRSCASQAPTVAQPPAPWARRSPLLWGLPIAALAVAAVVGSRPEWRYARPPAPRVQIHGSGLTQGRTITVSGPAGSISVGIQNVWVSLPGRDEIVRSSVTTGASADSSRLRVARPRSRPG